jgi:hypothetical protein
MDLLSRLGAIHDIQQVKARFLRAIDTRDPELLRSALAENVLIDFRDAARDPKTGFEVPSPATLEPIVGREKAVDQICGAFGDMTGVHHTGMPEIEIIDESNARGVWPMSDRLYLGPNAAVEQMIGFGHYHETYTVESGQWKIATLRLSRLRFYAVHRDPA